MSNMSATGARTVPAALLALATVLTVTSCAYLDPRASLDPLSGFSSEVYLLAPSEQPRDVTAEVCDERPGCERAAQSDRVRVLRFGSVSEAQTETYALGARGFRSDRFVVEFRDPATTQEEWATVASTVDHTATGSPD